MAVREFRDEQGRLWQAWDIRPEAIHPPTKAEDWLADCYVTGWIVFETLTGDEKRRLCPWPMNWAEADQERLRELLAAAEVVPPQRVAEQRSSGPMQRLTDSEVQASVADENLDVTDLDVVRTFRYPGGRFWTVCVVKHPEDGGAPVLRFTAGMRDIDLRRWPKDWADQPDDVLITMLRTAAPRRASGPPPPGIPRRRWDDLPQSMI
jgi:hypothetical protein